MQKKSRSYISGILRAAVILSILLFFFTAVIAFFIYNAVRGPFITEVIRDEEIITQAVQRYFTIPETEYEELVRISNSDASNHRIDGIVRSILLFSDVVHSVFYVDPQTARIREVWPEKHNYLHLDVSNQQYFVSAAPSDSDTFTWSDSFILTETGNPAIAFSKETERGILVMICNLSNLNSFFNISYSDDEDFIAAVDSRGKIIAHSDPGTVLRNTTLLHLDHVREGMNSGQYTGITTVNSSKGVLSVSPLKKTHYFIIQYRNLDSILLLLRTLIAGNILIVGMAVLSLFILLFIVFKRSLAPVLQLTSEFQKIADGSYDARLVSEFSEFQKLTRVFKKMVNTVQERETDLKVSVEEKNVLLRELHHRTKNNMQVIISMLSMQAMQYETREMQKVLEEAQGRIYSMSLVHQLLYETTSLTSIDIKTYATELSSHIQYSFNSNNSPVYITVTGEPVEIVLDSAIPCGLVLNELFTNSFKYALSTDRSCAITLEISAPPGGTLSLHYCDNGPGLPDNFDPRCTATLGFTLISSIVESQLKGAYSISPGPGFDISIEF